MENREVVKGFFHESTSGCGGLIVFLIFTSLIQAVRAFTS